jgi:hypothetical protein
VAISLDLRIRLELSKKTTKFISLKRARLYLKWEICFSPKRTWFCDASGCLSTTFCCFCLCVHIFVFLISFSAFSLSSLDCLLPSAVGNCDFEWFWFLLRGSFWFAPWSRWFWFFLDLSCFCWGLTPRSFCSPKNDFSNYVINRISDENIQQISGPKYQLVPFGIFKTHSSPKEFRQAAFF